MADTFSRYETNAASFEYYRGGILADQVRAYRGMYQRATRSIPTPTSTTWSPRSRRSPRTISTYIQLLGDRWQAVIDLAGLLQVDDLFQSQANKSSILLDAIRRDEEGKKAAAKAAGHKPGQ